VFGTLHLVLRKLIDEYLIDFNKLLGLDMCGSFGPISNNAITIDLSATISSIRSTLFACCGIGCHRLSVLRLLGFLRNANVTGGHIRQKHGLDGEKNIGGLAIRIYIAGAMRGIPNQNFAAFFTAEALLTMKGHRVVNPARLDLETGVAFWSPSENRISMSPDFTFEDAMRRDAAAMAGQCEAIVLLPGWEKSQGANTELGFARTFGFRVYLYKEGGEIEPYTE
jgi:hypothetical protein